MKIYSLIELFERNGNRLPFKAQWYNPGTAEHGRVLTFERRVENTQNRFYGFPVLDKDTISNPSLGIGWVIPYDEWKNQSLSRCVDLSDLLKVITKGEEVE